MEALRGVKLTGTNRPFDLAIKFPVRHASGGQGKKLNEASFDVASRSFNFENMRAVFGDASNLLVAIARGIHPIPFRTRKLSPSAPMVLPLCVGGRVGRCRNKFGIPMEKSKGRVRFMACWLGFVTSFDIMLHM